MDFKGRNIISAKDFSREEFLRVAELAGRFKHSPAGFFGRNMINGKTVAFFFNQPSTRTRGSFEFAVKSLGGAVVHYAEEGSSMEKGESLSDTLRVISGTGYDCIIIRHSDVHSLQSALNYSKVHPVINAGVADDEHPTQSFMDLFTILEKKRKIDGLKIGILGDLKHGRAVHSLAYALSRFKAAVYFFSNDSLKMPPSRIKELKKLGLSFEEHPEENLQSFMPRLDVLYATRNQTEYWAGSKNQKPLSINSKLISSTKPDFILMHPLPRRDEIATEVDNNPKAAYFEQAANGTPVRQALISLVLGAVK